MFASLLPLLFSSATLTAADSAALDAQVTEIFRPYSQETQDADSGAAWDRPLFSAEVTALIAHWKSVMPADEPDFLNDGDWFCQCQDWDAKKFKAVLGARKAVSADVAQVQATIDLGFDDPRYRRGAKLIFRREEGVWRLDDIIARDSFPKGLKQALLDTIRVDEVLAAETVK